MSKSKLSFYEALRVAVKKKPKSLPEGPLSLHLIIRQLREDKGLSGVALCKKAGDLDPRTLTAVEKGRIQNPSIKTLQSIARGLGVTISELFQKAEGQMPQILHQGSQKGVFQVEFPAWNTKVVSFTPLTHDFFCGKMILGAHARLDKMFLRHPYPFFAAVLVGKVEIQVGDERRVLREGENLFFNGNLPHSFYNSQQREAVLWMVTAPSFL